MIQQQILRLISLACSRPGCIRAALPGLLFCALLKLRVVRAGCSVNRLRGKRDAAGATYDFRVNVHHVE